MGDTTMNAFVREENLGALVLARTLPTQFTPHSNYYATNTIWFCEEIVKRRINIFDFDMVEQLSYLFTKGLPRTSFEYLRKNIMGW